MSRPVARGTFERSCGTCGWAGTYDTEPRADYFERRHVCERRLDRAARAQAYAEDVAAYVQRGRLPREQVAMAS